MTATLHEIEFRHDGINYMVSGEVEGPTDAPKVEITNLQVQCTDEFRAVEAMMVTPTSKRIIAVAENALIQAAEDRRLIYSCECCQEEFYGRPPECPGCEDRKEAAIDRAREV